MCYRRGKLKNLAWKPLCDSQSRNDPLVNKLEYKDNQKDPRRLIYPKHLSRISSSYQWTSRSLVFTIISFPNTAIPPDCTAKPYRFILAKTQWFSSSKTLSTFWMGVNCVWVQSLFNVWQWERGSRRDYKEFSLKDE